MICCFAGSWALMLMSMSHLQSLGSFKVYVQHDHLIVPALVSASRRWSLESSVGTQS